MHFNYGKSPILEGVSFDVEEGELCGLFGPNGCGKTTFFKCCLKFLKFHKGSVVMNGINITHHRIENMAKLVAYVPQEHKPPFPYLVKEVVLLEGLRICGASLGSAERTRNGPRMLWMCWRSLISQTSPTTSSQAASARWS